MYLLLILYSSIITIRTAAVDACPTMAKLIVLKQANGKKIRIIKRLAAYWRKLGLILDFDECGSQLDIIEQKCHGDPEACCQEMFQYWLKGNGVKPCSWRRLIELLEDCDQQALSEEIQEAISSLK